MTLFRWCWLTLALAACEAQLVDTYDACDLDGALSTPEARVGDVVVLTGGPLTTTWDTLVQVDGTLAEITTLSRDAIACFDCDSCRDEAFDCVSCDETCLPCVESISFVVPAVRTGVVSVVLTNAYGSTGPLALTIVAPSDTGLPTTTGGTGETALPLETAIPVDTSLPVDTDRKSVV